MTIAKRKTSSKNTATSRPQRMTLEAYLNYDDGTETRYELVDGVLVEMSTETPLNHTIAIFLLSYFLRSGIPHYCLAMRHQIQVPSNRASAREPDLIVHSEASAAAIIEDGKLLRIAHPQPRLVVEVVSSSDTDKVSRDRDYIEKRREYAQREIPEYWIVDPIAKVVMVLSLTGDTYRESVFSGAEPLVSVGFAELALTAEQVLTANL